MHLCSESPNSKRTEDSNCLDVLASNYTFVYRVGDKESVSASLVFKLSRETQDVAVKVIPLKDDASLNDTRLSCLLNGLDEATPIFIKTLGWLKCNTIPATWIRDVDMQRDVPKVFKAKKNTYIFQVMAFTSHAWSDARIHLSVEEYRVMLFLLIHGLWLARTRHNIRHNDVHEGQVLFQTCKKDTPITVSVGKQSFQVMCERFVPKLIDFGLATTEDEESESGSGSGSEEDSMFDDEDAPVKDEDLRNLLEMFEQRMVRDKLKPFAYSLPKVERTFESLLLKDKVFDSIRKSKATTVESPLVRCDVCSSHAQHQWQGTNVRFCGEVCAYSWRGIQELL